MFGYIQANLKDLSKEEQIRYRSAYCGLCRTLGEKHGISAKLALSYDLTFVALLLSSLYEPDEKNGTERCIIHPLKKHEYMTNTYTEYAADMTLALTYFNSLDDWKDDKNISRKCYASLLSSKYDGVREKWPKQCSTIERELEKLSEIEKQKAANPDEAANCCGRFMEAVLVPRSDNWEPYLRKIGFGLGKFIYIADAACDYYSDIKKGSYNPLVLTGETPGNIRPALTGILGNVSKAFETLPLLQDEHLLKNILYSGIWLKYNIGMEKNQKSQKGAFK